MSVFFRQLFGLGVISGVAYWFWRYFAPQHSTLVLDNKVVVVTGASSGRGKVLALSFAKRGTRVVLVGTQTDALGVVQREIEPYASAVFTIEADVIDSEQHKVILQQTLETFGRIDILVNYVGIVSSDSRAGDEAKNIREIIEVNLTSTILLTRTILPVMLAQGEGYILFTSPDLGRRATPAFSAYVASKQGISGFADSLRQELVGSNIHITLATPNWLDRAAVDNMADEIVEGLVQGQDEVIFGGFWGQLGIVLERISPRLSQWYWAQIKAATS